MACKTDLPICFSCAQQAAPDAPWQRREAFGSGCAQCGERPQGLFVKRIVPSALPGQRSGTQLGIESAAYDQLEEEELECTILQSLQQTSSSNVLTTDSNELPHEASQYPWLADFLVSAELYHYFQEAIAWCDSMGAVEADDILENLEDFVKCLQLSHSEHDRLSTLHHVSLQPTSSSKALQQVLTCTSASSAVPSYEFSDSGGACSPHWLADWLVLTGLHQYFKEAATWCDSMGASEASEILENLDDFAEHLQLSDSDRERLSAFYHASQLEMSMAEPAAPCTEAHQEAAMDDTSEDAAASSTIDGCTTFGSADASYTILEQLGRGATATVYKCRLGDKLFAAKEIELRRMRMLGNSNQILAMLNREISLLRTLNHQKIVRLHEVVDTPSRRFLVLDLVDGGDLLHHILSQGDHGLSESESRHVFVQVIDGLGYIHSRNVIHRDLKPDNILIDSTKSQPGLPDIKLSDFGFSKQMHDWYTRPHTKLGTPQYWAPEVEDGSGHDTGYDQRADLWSLGVLLYVMLTAKYPFSGDSVAKRAERFTFHGSRHTEELVRGLIRLQPADRLSLKECLECPWLADTGINRPKLSREPSVRHVLVRLPCAPADTGALKAQLMSYSCSHKVSADLQLLDVVVRFPCGTSDLAIQQAKAELNELLVQYVPELRKLEDEGESSLAPFVEALAEECEVLSSIYGQDFEVISSTEWRIQLQDGLIVHIHLPHGYPDTHPPLVDVECPTQVLPAGLTASLHEQWTAGSVCVYEWVELLRVKLLQASPFFWKPAESQQLTEEAARSEDKGFEIPSRRGARGQKRPAKKFTEQSADERHAVEMHTARPVEEKKSIFQAHGAHVASQEQVDWVWCKLLMDKKIGGAQHNFVAFRYRDRESKQLVEDCDSDKEDGAGGMLARLLEKRGLEGVFIMVSRRYGGQNLGSLRHKAMNRAAMNLLETMEPEKSVSSAKQTPKRANKKSNHPNVPTTDDFVMQ